MPHQVWEYEYTLKSGLKVGYMIPLDNVEYVLDFEEFVIHMKSGSTITLFEEWAIKNFKHHFKWWKEGKTWGDTDSDGPQGQVTHYWSDK